MVQPQDDTLIRGYHVLEKQDIQDLRPRLFTTYLRGTAQVRTSMYSKFVQVILYLRSRRSCRKFMACYADGTTVLSTAHCATCFPRSQQCYCIQWPFPFTGDNARGYSRGHSRNKRKVVNQQARWRHGFTLGVFQNIRLEKSMLEFPLIIKFSTK